MPRARQARKSMDFYFFSHCRKLYPTCCAGSLKSPRVKKESRRSQHMLRTLTTVTATTASSTESGCIKKAVRPERNPLTKSGGARMEYPSRLMKPITSEKRRTARRGAPGKTHQPNLLCKEGATTTTTTTTAEHAVPRTCASLTKGWPEPNDAGFWKNF